MLTICYKTNEPVYYNKGTEWEKTCDTFMAHPFYGTKEQAEKRVKEYNENKPAQYKDAKYFYLTTDGNDKWD